MQKETKFQWPLFQEKSWDRSDICPYWVEREYGALQKANNILVVIKMYVGDINS